MIEWVGSRRGFLSQAAAVEPSWFLLHQLLYKTQPIPAKQNLVCLFLLRNRENIFTKCSVHDSSDDMRVVKAS